MNDQPTPPSHGIIPHEPPVIQPSSPPPRRARSGCLYGVVGMIGCLILLLIIPVTLLILGVTSMDSIIGSLGTALGVGEPPRASVISTQTIIEGIQPLGELVTVSVQLAKIGVQVNVNQGTLNACGFSANHAVQGTVEAGIDMTQISAGDLTYDSARATYVLTVPAPQLTSCRIDNIAQYNQSFTTCSVDWDGARQLAQYMALTSFRDDAIEGGILTRAQSETQVVLGNFVRLLTGHQVEVDFQPSAAATEFPSSCEPDVPAGWTYDSGSNLWYK